MAFDPLFAKDVALPLTQAAYAVMDGADPDLPADFQQTGVIRATLDPGDVTADQHPAVKAMLKNTAVFGLVGRSTTTKTAFMSLRGSQDLEDWLHNLDIADGPYLPVAGFGRVHLGFQAAYQVIRDSVATNVASACQGCNQLLITGHSLGGALAVLSAPDLLQHAELHLEPKLITFGSPRVGLADFTTAFDAHIESCFRVVNYLDIVPHVPWSPYTHCGAEIDVDSEGDITARHDLTAYREGLATYKAPLTTSAAA